MKYTSTVTILWTKILKDLLQSKLAKCMAILIIFILTFKNSLINTNNNSSDINNFYQLSCSDNKDEENDNYIIPNSKLCYSNNNQKFIDQNIADIYVEFYSQLNSIDSDNEEAENNIIDIYSKFYFKLQSLEKIKENSNNNIYSEFYAQLYSLDNDKITKIFNKILNEEFNYITGFWEISNFIGHGIESHCEETYEKDYSTSDKEAKLYIGKKFKINEESIAYFDFAGCSEHSSICHNYEEMFFGEKPPIEMKVKYPAHRYYIRHKDKYLEGYFILDSNGQGILNLQGNYFYLKLIDKY